MIVFVLLCILNLAFIPTAILMKKKKISFGWGSVIILVTCTFGAMNLVSGIYHIAGNDAAYRSAIKTRGAILEREAVLLRIEEADRDQKEVESVKKDARYFNLDLQEDARLASDPWIGMYAFRFAAEHFDELYITLAL